jgi:hypothetical protein
MRFRIIRNQKVVTDADLADALNIPSKSFIAFFKRNMGAFDKEIYFELTELERADLVQNYCFTHAERLRYAKRLPFIFTKQAVIQVLCMHSKNYNAKVMRRKILSAPQIETMDLEEILK